MSSLVRRALGWVDDFILDSTSDPAGWPDDWSRARELARWQRRYGRFWVLTRVLWAVAIMSLSFGLLLTVAVFIWGPR